MNILIISDNFYPEINAAATRVYERSIHWVKLGHKVTVITSNPNFPEGKLHKGYENRLFRREIIDGIDVIRVYTYITANEGIVLRTLDFISFMFASCLAGFFVKDFSVIIASSPQFFTAIGGYILSIIKRKKLILEIADLWPETIRSVINKKYKIVLDCFEVLELHLYHNCYKIVVLTNSFKINLIKRGINRSKIFTVLNGVELNMYKPIIKNIDLIEKYALKGKFVIGYIGNHGPCQDLSNVLSCAKLMKNTNIVFLLIGSGAEKEFLENSIKLNKLHTIVISIPSVKKSFIKQYWSICDVALIHLKNHCAFRKVIPSKIFEAMGMGLPILLVAPKGESWRLIKSYNNGVCISSGRPNDMLSGVNFLYNNKEMRKRYSKNSIRHVKMFSRKQQAINFLNVI